MENHTSAIDGATFNAHENGAPACQASEADLNERLTHAERELQKVHSQLAPLIKDYCSREAWAEVSKGVVAMDRVLEVVVRKFQENREYARTYLRQFFKDMPTDEDFELHGDEVEMRTLLEQLGMKVE